MRKTGFISKVGFVSLGAPWSSAHTFKYSLFYGYPGKRLASYDNERGKGDHRHIGDRQERYVFSSVEKLVADFLSDVRRIRGES